MLRFPDQDLPESHPDRRLLSTLAGRLGVREGAVALAGSMAEYVAAGLAARPVVRDGPRQAELTARFLTPVLPGLDALFRHLRAGLDDDLRRARPTRGGRPYPLGQCLEIAKAVLARLDGPAPARLPTDAARAWAALADFRAAGGEVRRAWGDLRGEYFQNALIVGVLYVDAANDTVVVTKPPVEILPLDDADFRPVRDYAHFARIAARYWGVTSLPNHLLPDLAPYLPLIQLAPNGAPAMGQLDPHMLGLTLAGRFRPSEGALSAPVLPRPLFDCLREVLAGGPFAVASDPATGRAAALARCRAWRAEGRFDDAPAFNAAMLAAVALNRRLAGARVGLRPFERIELG